MERDLCTMFLCTFSTYYRDIITNNTAWTKTTTFSLEFQENVLKTSSRFLKHTFIPDSSPQKKKTHVPRKNQVNQVESSSSRQTKEIQVWCRHWQRWDSWSPNKSSDDFGALKLGFVSKKSKDWCFLTCKKLRLLYEVWFGKIWGSALVDSLWFFVYFEGLIHDFQKDLSFGDGWNTNMNHLWFPPGFAAQVLSWIRWEVETQRKTPPTGSFIGLGSNSSILVDFLGTYWMMIPIV